MEHLWSNYYMRKICNNNGIDRGWNKSCIAQLMQQEQQTRSPHKFELDSTLLRVNKMLALSFYFF